MYTIGQLARQFGLTRSTLLYYDRIGLLRASRRVGANYRRYGREEAERLEKIRFYRRTGLSLEEIQRLLDEPADTEVTAVLERRLRELGGEIQELRDRQRIILGLLKREMPAEAFPGIDRRKWTAMLRAAGLDEDGMHRWHTAFERSSPEGHRQFLEGLGISVSEIERIRQWSLRMEAVSPGAE